MSRIPFDAVGFAPGAIPPATRGPLAASLGQLAWAAVTIGRTPFSTPLARRDAAFEAAWRAAMVWANLTPDTITNSYRRSTSYARLDMSEKGSVSFFLGQMQAKLFAERIFGVGVFAHVDAVLESQGRPRSRTRPDFIGYDISHAVALAVEAKGRTNGWTDSLVTKAKTQAAGLPSVLGVAPPLTYAHIAYFQDNEWHAYLADPPRERHVSEPISTDIVALAYYQPLVDLLVQLRARSPQVPVPEDADDRYVWGQLNEAGLYVGVDAALLSTFIEARSLPGEPGRSAQPSFDKYFGTDGVAVLLDQSWAALDGPQARRSAQA